MADILKIYILIFGAASILAGALEFIFPSKTAQFWKQWSASRYYRLHGIFLIAAGIPLTAAEGRFSLGIFIMGLVIVLTGPFILLYPEKFRNNYALILSETGKEGLSKLIMFDAAVKVMAGAICAANFLL